MRTVREAFFTIIREDSERFRFRNRQQQNRETVADYLDDLRKLAIHCEFGEFLEDALCNRLVCGLKDEAMQRRLLGETDLSLRRLLR